MDCDVRTEPVLLDDGWMLVNTDMMADLLADGRSVGLPVVNVDGRGDFENFSEADLSDLASAVAGGEVASVEYIGEEEVQCIEVDDVDHLYMTDSFVVTHNTSNIVFLKSTDDSMLDTLQKMSGTTHQARTDSKMVTRDVEKIWMRNQGAMSITMSVKEEPVISYNDMAFISERNSIVFRAGDSPIWNRNETILPMSWRLFSNKIVHPGHDYTLQTIPTLSSAMDFDVRMNQPDFQKMLDKRVGQALKAKNARILFQEAYGYSDYEVERLDPDVYSDAVMDIINARMHSEAGVSGVDEVMESKPESVSELISSNTSENEEQKKANAEAAERQRDWDEPRYAGRQCAKSDFMSVSGQVNRGLEKLIVSAFLDCRTEFERDYDNFVYKGGALWSAFDATVLYIRKRDETDALKMINEAKDEISTKVYADDEVNVHDLDQTGTFEVTDDFYKFLVSMDNWTFAYGAFEREMSRLMDA